MQDIWKKLRIPVYLVMLSAAVPGLFTGTVRAEEEVEPDEEEHRDLATVEGEIEVTSTVLKIATELDLAGDELEAAAKSDLVETLREVPGLAGLRRGPVNLDPIVRGLQETQVATFVDGTRTFAAGPARMDSGLSHVDTHGVANVRVVKGPYALTWGAGTLSAIDLVTHRPPFSAGGVEWGGKLRLGYLDNAGRSDGHGGIWGAGEHYRLRLDVARRTGDDYEDGDGVEVPGDFETTNLRWNLGWSPSEGSLFEYSGGYQEQFDIDYPGRLLDATYFYTRSHNLEWSRAGDGRSAALYAQVYANRKDHLMNNDEKPTARDMPGRIPPFALRVDLPTESNTSGGKFQATLARGDLDWTFGADFYRVEQTARRTISRRDPAVVLFEDIVWPDAEIDDLGGYARVAWSGESSRVSGALRLDSVDASAGELSDFFRANVEGEIDQSETNASAAVAASFEAGERWVWSVGVGRAVRTATVTERYSDRFPSTKFQLAAEFLGNPELDPEKSLEIDLGARGRYGELLVQADFYYRVIDDYITVLPDPSVPKRLPLSPPVVYRYVNGSEAVFYGGELLLDQRVSSAFSWRASLSYVWGEDRAFDEPVLGLPPLTGELGVRYNLPRRDLYLDLSATIADRQDRVATSRFEQATPGHTVFNLAAGYRWSDRLALSAGVENLFDRTWSDHLNSPNPFSGERIGEMGRAFRLGLEVGF